MALNPLKWPEFEQLGREFHEQLSPALDQLARGQAALDDEARRGLEKLEHWLAAPCAATVKIDGTNLGVDNTGLIVGRNRVVEEGASYQRVDVWSVLKGTSEKVELLRHELDRLAGGGVIAQAMLYGELCVQGKYDYAAAGIFNGWLCFGGLLRFDAEGDPAVSRRVSERLRAEGFNAKPLRDKVLVVPSPRFESLLARLGVPSVLSSYRPGCIPEGEWAAHSGEGRLPRFASMRQLLLSEWAQRLLLPVDGVALCEGLVLASEANAKLFKWKQAGEELGRVPEQLSAIVEQLRQLGDCELLPEGILEVCERLLLVATTKPKVRPAAKATKAAPKESAAVAAQPTAAEDAEALAVWESALTKYDALEEVFSRGSGAVAERQAELIEQIAKDLVKDYDALERDAVARAKRVVRRTVGQRHAAWLKACSAAA